MPMSMSYNDSIMESWFHRSRGVSGFMCFVVSMILSLYDIDIGVY